MIGKSPWRNLTPSGGRRELGHGSEIDFEPAKTVGVGRSIDDIFDDHPFKIAVDGADGFGGTGAPTGGRGGIA